ncbi:MAG: amidohydrolase family protein [Planctomycetota bacterium]|nr:amidohydrolase family protein [Planctomycetota bacterium]
MSGSESLFYFRLSGTFACQLKCIRYPEMAKKKKKRVASPRGDGMSSNRTGVDLRNPPPRRIPGPIIDAHAHVAHPKIAKLFVEVARTYHIDKVIAISTVEDAEALRKRYGTFFEFYYRPPFDEKDKPRIFKKKSLERIDEAVENGFKALKFWFKPQFNYDQKMYFDDRRLYPLFERAGEHGIPCITHIADPDIWFERVYTSRRKFLTKRGNYRQFRNAFRDHPDVTFIGAHMAGDPEHLDHLQELLDEHPNLVVDCSATKWVARELSEQAADAREFFIRNSDRIMFGTDLVTFPGITDFDRYASRYWVHQIMWETGRRCESPIDDPDSPDVPKLHGLDLPDDVLEKLNWRNAVRIFNLKRPRVRTAMPRA